MNRKHVRIVCGLASAFCLFFEAATRVSAAITIATVPVGNLGNSPSSSGFGSVNYAYSIAQYDVTSDQYTAFLNAVAQTDTFGLYNSSMAGTGSGNPGIVQSNSSGSYSYSVVAGRGSHPVTDVTFWDATRFANWLANGQPTGPEGAGTTETGTYTLTSTAITNNTVTRNAGSTWAVTSEDEWYKAAYYSPVLAGGAYWFYPTQSSSITTSQANYDGVIGDTTNVGAYPFPSYYGTYDEGGNVIQWNESIYATSLRGARGGSWVHFDVAGLQNINGGSASASGLLNTIGFRVSVVPEPASLAILTIGLMGLLARRVENNGKRNGGIKRGRSYFLRAVRAFH